MDLSRATWKKSSRSSGDGQCTEVAHLDGVVGVRDSKDTDGPVLVFTREAWTRFVRALKLGDLA